MPTYVRTQLTFFTYMNRAISARLCKLSLVKISILHLHLHIWEWEAIVPREQPYPPQLWFTSCPQLGLHTQTSSEAKISQESRQLRARDGQEAFLHGCSTTILSNLGGFRPPYSATWAAVRPPYSATWAAVRPPYSATWAASDHHTQQPGRLSDHHTQQPGRLPTTILSNLGGCLTTILSNLG